MKILIITQKIDRNDSVLGFFCRWVEEFSKHCEQVTVIALGEGTHNLPKNVRVFSLGKERGASRIGYLYNFYRLIWHERKNYDVVFIHMNPEYVILGGILWKILRKKIALWYTHKVVSWYLRVAEKLSNDIFTASKESFRLSSEKLHITGHGIDTDLFSPAPVLPVEMIILNVGRISRTKQQLDAIKIFEHILKISPGSSLHIVGNPLLVDDKDYRDEIQAYISLHGLGERISLLGAIPNYKMPDIYRHASVLINLSRTGSLDKDVLEAIACGVPAVTTNEAFQSMLGPYGLFVTDPGDPLVVAKAIVNASGKDMAMLVGRVRNEHSLSTLIIKIMNQLSA